MPDQVLLAAGVQPWTELPMWAPETPEFAALWDVTGDRALRTGLRYRPLSDTVRDTWGWLRRDATAHGGEMVFAAAARDGPGSGQGAGDPGQPGLNRGGERCDGWVGSRS